MSSIPFSSRRYRDAELTTPDVTRLLASFAECRRRLDLVKTSHLNPLSKEWRILERFLARHAVPLRHEKGVLLARRVARCVKRIFRHPDADVVRMTGNLLDLCRVDEKDKTLPSRQTCQHFLAALRRVLELYSVCHSHAADAYGYFSTLLTVGHLVPAFLCFAGAVARVAVIARGLVALVGRWYDEMRPGIHALKGEDADLSAIYGEDALPETAPAIESETRDSEKQKTPLRVFREIEKLGDGKKRVPNDVVAPTRVDPKENPVQRSVGETEEDVGEVVGGGVDSSGASGVSKRKKKRTKDEGEKRTSDTGAVGTPKKLKKRKKRVSETSSVMTNREKAVSPAHGLSTGGVKNGEKRKSQPNEETVGAAEIGSKPSTPKETARPDFDEIDAIFGEKKRKKDAKRGQRDPRDVPEENSERTHAVSKSKKKKTNGQISRSEGEVAVSKVDPSKTDEIDDIFGDFT